MLMTPKNKELSPFSLGAAPRTHSRTHSVRASRQTRGWETQSRRFVLRLRVPLLGSSLTHYALNVRTSAAHDALSSQYIGNIARSLTGAGWLYKL